MNPLPWRDALTQVLEFVQGTTPAGAPPPAAREALFALDCYARIERHCLPTPFLGFLRMTNGLSMPWANLSFHGIGVPPEDEFGRTDFLITNSRVLRSPRYELADRTHFGRVGEFALVWNPAAKRFQRWHETEFYSPVNYDSFEALLATELSIAVAGMLATAGA